MVENDPGLLDSILAALKPARDWAQGKAEPYLTWLPDWLEPYAVDAVAVLLLLSAVIVAWERLTKLWRAAIWAPRRLWRWATGYEPPPSETEIAGETAARIEQRIEDFLRARSPIRPGKPKKAARLFL